MSTTVTQSQDILYRVRGGGPVGGTIRCLGAKNLATKAMVASLLGDSPTHLTNVPQIGDVTITRDMLASIGARVSVDGTSMLIDPTTVRSSTVPMPQSGSNRIPILMLAPLLHRFEEASIPVLGGCSIGARTVDFHLQALRQFGAEVETTPEGFRAYRRGPLKGTSVRLAYPSVGATETCLFLAVLAKGRSVISNVALEPEISELITMLQSMGAVIFRSSGRDLRIEGVDKLCGTPMHVTGDRIEAVSWATLAVATDGEITVEGFRPETLGNYMSYLSQVGGAARMVDRDSVRFFRAGSLRSAVAETDVYPGFSTDYQQPFAVLLTQAQGVSVIHETVYEKRFDYLSALTRLGANVQLTTHCLGSECRYRETSYQHSAIIVGPTELHSDCEIEIPDLRAGLAYVIAAATARGETRLKGGGYLERGYGDIVPRLSRMNLNISRELI